MLRFPPTTRNSDGSIRPTAIAVDFDGCLALTKFPEILAPNLRLIKKLVTFQRRGGELILYTCREGELLKDALRYCAQFGLAFDAVNDSLPRWKAYYKDATRKPGADYYLDDKAVRVKAKRNWRRRDAA